MIETCVAVIGVVILESINMVTVRHDGKIFTLCIGTVAGLGGFCIGQVV